MSSPPSLPLNYLGNCGTKVSNLCLGTRTLGEAPDTAKRWKTPGQCNEELSHRMLDKYMQLGGNFIDTANIYNIGASESVIGTWLQHQDRERIVLATKVGFPLTKSEPNQVGLSRKHIMHSFEESLKRLKTDYVDLYLTHRWDDGTPLEETLRTLTDLVRSGKVRYLGLSNVTGWQLQKIIDMTKYKGYEPFVCLQAQYSLLCRQAEWELLEVCRRENLGFHPWSPLKGGWLTGKMTRSGAPEGSRAAWSDKESIISESTPGFSTFRDDERAWHVLDVLKDLSKEIGKSIPQIAIKWLLHQPGVSPVVIGAKTLVQLEDNMTAGDDSWQLTQDQLQRLQIASDVPPPYPYGMINRLQTSRSRDGVQVL